MSELRQALNKIDITGVVKEHKLGEGKTEKGEKYINGNIVVKAGEFTEVTVRVFVTEKTSKGKVKKAYESLGKILSGELKTMAEVPKEEAVKVRLWGNDGFSPQFKEEIFKTENSPEVVTLTSIDLGFGNVTIDNNITPEDYKATFDVEMFVEAVEEEVVNDEETGRVVIKGWVPVYGGAVIPLELKAGIISDDEGEYDFGEDVLNNVDPETTVNFWGDIDYRSIVERVSKGGSLGRAKVDEKRTYVHDLVAIGADFVEGEGEYEVEDIQQARLERENKKQEVENKANESGSKRRKGTGTVNRRSARKASSEVSADTDVDDLF